MGFVGLFGCGETSATREGEKEILGRGMRVIDHFHGKENFIYTGVWIIV